MYKKARPTFCFWLMSTLILVASFGAAFYPSILHAHGTGASIEKVVGNYLIDLGYDPEILESDNSIIFDFDLAINETGERADFTSIWIRIVREKQTLFASGIHRPSFGNTTMLYTFPQSGEYELITRFQSEGDTIAETSFPLKVESGSRASGSGLVSRFLVWIILSMAVGAISGFILAIAVRRAPGKPSVTLKEEDGK